MTKRKTKNQEIKIEEAQPKSKAWGITALAVSTLSILLFMLPYFGLPLAIFSLVAAGVQKPKNGFSTAGLVVGILSTIINAVTLLILLLVLLFAY